ncbi:citrulline utilization hydrolase CtlX [Sphingomicrobium nitratireducens]|uniref:citrulline utilization hydrolase CtlX n=1 Tax=Sphingomicrobium nitratireducens TaxID=2964666 RepID=UPI0022409261
MPDTTYARAALMVRPHRFRVNAETASDNHFQRAGAIEDTARAFDEVTRVAAALEKAGVEVVLAEDEGDATPDSVFPNNWLTTHRDGRVALYPMRAESRRGERREDILALLAERFALGDVVDYSVAEAEGRFLEGTGAMVLDRSARVAYVARSPRSDEELLGRFCSDFGYEACQFDASDAQGRAIYHTNVVMALLPGLALVGLDMVGEGRAALEARLAEGGYEIMALSGGEIGAFAGNMLALEGREGAVIACSTTALAALSQAQRARIGRAGKIVPFDIPTVEKAGGSARCMLAEIFLPRK